VKVCEVVRRTEDVGEEAGARSTEKELVQEKPAIMGAVSAERTFVVPCDKAQLVQGCSMPENKRAETSSYQ